MRPSEGEVASRPPFCADTTATACGAADVDRKGIAARYTGPHSTKDAVPCWRKTEPEGIPHRSRDENKLLLQKSPRGRRVVAAP